MSDQAQSYDLIIVGSGVGALVAALKANALGLRAIILEKQERVGGSSALSGGVLWIPANPIQRRAGIEDSVERARLYLDGLIERFGGGAGATPARLAAYLAEGPALVSFLEQEGIRLRHCADRPDYYDDLPGGHPDGRSLEAELFNISGLGDWSRRLLLGRVHYPMMGHESRRVLLAQANLRGALAALRIGSRMIRERLSRSAILGAGASLQGRLLQAVLRSGVPILPGTPATRLISSGGRVQGVIAEREGMPVRFNARRGVLLDTGGFSHNAEMREAYGPPPATNQWTLSNPGDTGEMMLRAMELGAATDLMDEAWWLPISLPPGGGRMIHVTDIAKPGSIVVDQTARRYVDESVSYMEFGQRMLRRHAQVGAVPSWCIMDSRHRARYAWGGVLPFQTPRAWHETGYMKRAETLDALAVQCGLDSRALGETVQRFNGFAATGGDEDFGRGRNHFGRYYADPGQRPNASLGPIDKPPYYAVALYPGDVGTAGGLVADEHARVLDRDGRAIPGLLATGNVTAPVFGRVYPGAGASIGASAVFASIAVDEAARTAPYP